MHWLAVLLLIAQLAFPIKQAHAAQAGPEITDLGVTTVFGEHITFRLRVEPLDSIQQLLVFITPEGQSTVWQEISLENASADGVIQQQVDVRQLTLYPFSKIHYRYQATLTDGSQIQLEASSFQYEDNRFTWQAQTSGTFEVYWYNDDPTLGQMIVNIADAGLRAAQGILPVKPPGPIRIYAYTSTRDLQTALQMTSQPWIAGHATPELGMVLISVPSGPERKLELERQIPHEIMHVLQYQVMGANFTNQPVWLVEGMASLVEVYPNPEYRIVLERTIEEGTLIPMRSLCSTFPRDAGGAFQSYAQSESFVRFLYTKYGASGLRSLIEQYQNGLGCEEGFLAATGLPLSQAEYRWQQEALGLDMGGLVMSNLSPYLLISLVVLVPVALTFLPLRRKDEPEEEDL